MDNHHYSETEQEIGVWLDGKPLYEITIVDNFPSLNGYNIDISELHIDTLIRFDGVFVRGSGNNIQPYPHNTFENSSAYEMVRVQARDGVANGNLYIDIHYSAASKVIVILEYTKTTD